MENPAESHEESHPASPVEPGAASLTGKKVLLAVTKSNWGGAQNYVSVIAKGAKDAGAEVSVMAGGADGKGGSSGRLFDVLAENDIRTIPLLAIERDFGLSSEWRALKELIAVIKKEKPDVLHLNSSKMGALGAIAGRFAGAKRIIFTAHGWPYLERRPLWWNALAWIGSWAIVAFSSKIICVSDYDLRTSPVLLFRDKLIHIDNGVKIFPLLSKEEARRELAKKAPELNNYSQLLIMTSELHANKGIASSIRALADLSDRYPSLALVVCGEGEERARLTELAQSLNISSRVFLLGFVENAKQYLRAGDIFLMPSEKEGMPLGILEAGLASLPVIATKVGGIPDIITDQETGLFMPRGNTQILSKAISYLLDNPEVATRLGQNLFKKVSTEFTDEQMISSTLATY